MTALRVPCPSVRAARAWARRKAWRSRGWKGQSSGVLSANSAATVLANRPWSVSPVSGSNRPRRHHIPSSSIHVSSRVARRCRSRRAIPSSARSWSISTVNALCSSAGRRRRGRARPATRPTPPARRGGTARAGAGPARRRRRARRVTVPASSASPNAGIAVTVRARSRTRSASRAEVRAASATICSGRAVTSASPAAKAHVAPVQPGSQPGHRRHRGDQHLPVAAVVIDPDDLPDQPMDLRPFHTNRTYVRGVTQLAGGRRAPSATSRVSGRQGRSAAPR